MRKKVLIVITAFFIGIVLPILGMYNCSGFNTGTMSVQSCIIDNALLRSYANFYSGWVIMSSYVLFVPIFAYIVGLVVATNYIAKRFFNVEFKKKTD